MENLNDDFIDSEDQEVEWKVNDEEMKGKAEEPIKRTLK
jgi:hypothetical protein